MKIVDQTISKNKLFRAGDIVGVAVSGGVDSMALLHYLNSVKEKLKISVIAITINHQIRQSGKDDAEFVVNYCKKHGIDAHMFSANVPELSKKNKTTIEEEARGYRYRTFEKLLKDKVVTKIALGHHMQDQAETILLNIFRGTGLAGASGMDVVRDGVFVRPFLHLSKNEVVAYAHLNDVPYVEDETNLSTEYSRNYLRNLVMPLIRNKWKGADQQIVEFGARCKKDEDYINSTIVDDAVVLENEQTIKIPVSYFVYDQPVLNRLIIKSVKRIGVTSNLESKHIDIITNLALKSENGARVNLPNKMHAIKEYNFVTITNKGLEVPRQEWKFALGKTDIANFGVLEVVRVNKVVMGEYHHLVDSKKIPKQAVWRYREDGDVFEKFGGGTKSLSSYLTDKKVPARLRNVLPVLAHGNEILVIAGYEISNKVKIDQDSKNVYGINAVRFN